MPKVAYKPRTMGPKRLAIIREINRLIGQYLRSGYKLTLRQLYYRFVAAGAIKNTQKNYKRLGDIVNEGRLQGLIDWNAIEDRTRNLQGIATQQSPERAMRRLAAGYRRDLWDNQRHRIEVWCEKDALLSIVERVAAAERIDWFSCRGYTSQSEMRGAAMRLQSYLSGGQTPVILHFGDHDPSGQDMTGDIRRRMAMFLGKDAQRLEIKRIALNMSQVTEYAPPPNPAKVTDSRYEGYVRKYGEYSWELDALPPEVLAGLIRRAVRRRRDDALWTVAKAREEAERRSMRTAAKRWADVVAFLDKPKGGKE